MSHFKTDILQKAEDNIHGERVKNYGFASESFKQVAAIASILVGKQLTPQDVLKVMIAVKLVRNSYSPMNDDHRIDACGYLGLLDEVEKATMEAPKSMDEHLYEIAAHIAAITAVSHNVAAAHLRSLFEQGGGD